jgi:hypothetical protein
LLKAGHTVTSTWHDLEFKRIAETTDEERRAGADRNLDQIFESDALVLITPKDYMPGGLYVEAGAALGIGLPVFSVGYRPGGLRGNFIMYHSLVSQYATIEGAVQAMEEK